MVLNSRKKTYNELSLNPGTSGVKDALPPEKGPKEEKEDLRFAGFDYKPEFEWKIIDTREKEKIMHGLLCKKFLLIGIADYAHLELNLWVSPRGKEKGLKYVSEMLNNYQRFFDASSEIAKLLEQYPDGGIVDFKAVLDPAISSEMTFSGKIEGLEETAPPDNIYEIPEGYTKGKRQ